MAYKINHKNHTDHGKSKSRSPFPLIQRHAQRKGHHLSQEAVQRRPRQCRSRRHAGGLRRAQTSRLQEENDSKANKCLHLQFAEAEFGNNRRLLNPPQGAELQHLTAFGQASQLTKQLLAVANLTDDDLAQLTPDERTQVEEAQTTLTDYIWAAERNVQKG